MTTNPAPLLVGKAEIGDRPEELAIRVVRDGHGNGVRFRACSSLRPGCLRGAAGAARKAS